MPRKNGRPRRQDVRRYKPEETGTRTFNIEDIAAETTSYVRENGDAYIGSEFKGDDIIILIKRKHDERGENIS
jgi:hypothetical protein